MQDFSEASNSTELIAEIGRLQALVGRLEGNASTQGNVMTLESRPDQRENDWLYDPLHFTDCGQIVQWDNELTSIFSRVLLPCVFLGAFMAIYLIVRCRRASMKRGQADLEKGMASDVVCRGEATGPLTRPVKKERMWHLDYARIVCVACIVVEHTGGEQYSFRNIFFVLQWVLPFIFSISGICSMLSRSGLWYYCSRLTLVLLIGCGANLASDIISGRDWMGDPFNIIFQMFYVIMLLLLAPICEPLRQFLRRTSPTLAGEDVASKAATKPGVGILAVTLLWATLALAGMAYFVLGISPVDVSSGGEWMQTTGQVLKKLPIMFAEVFGMIFLAHFAALSGAGESAGWVMLVVIYLPRVFLPWEGVGYGHNIQLYILGMWVTKWPLARSDRVKALVRMYWPLIMTLILFLHMPEYAGRCDVIPVKTWFHRLRWYGIECILHVLFVSGAFNTSGDSYGLTRWLSPWALFAYCFHVAADRVLPKPYATVVMFASAGIFYLIFGRQPTGAGKKSEAEAGLKLDDPMREGFNGCAADRKEGLIEPQSAETALAAKVKELFVDEAQVERLFIDEEVSSEPVPTGPGSRSPANQTPNATAKKSLGAQMPDVTDGPLSEASVGGRRPGNGETIACPAAATWFTCMPLAH